VKRIRIGASDHLAVRPLLHGLSGHGANGVEIVRDEPGSLALSLERGDLDAALIPSIEFLRGAGAFAVHGPALVARDRTMGLLLVAKKPIPEIRRVAVGEFSRTPLVALRAVLDKQYEILPDLCVVKRRPLNASNWREDFDAAFLTDDEGLRYARYETTETESYYDVGEMWRRVYSRPLVVSVWAYNDEGLGEMLEPLLASSRDEGLKNLAAISDSVSRSTSYDAGFLLDYYSNSWGFDMGPGEEEGLRILEDVACEYQLLQNRRLERAEVL
jgi:chorismate dehydratase